MNFKFIYYCIRVYALPLCYQEMAIDTEQDLIRDIQKHKIPAKRSYLTRKCTLPIYWPGALYINNTFLYVMYRLPQSEVSWPWSNLFKNCQHMTNFTDQEIMILLKIYTSIPISKIEITVAGNLIGNGQTLYHFH